MDDYYFVIDVCNDWDDLEHYDDLRHNDDLNHNDKLGDYKEAEDWGQFIDIDNNVKRNTDFLYNKKENYIYIDKYELKKIQQNSCEATNLILKISSTTFITIGLTYLILFIL